MTLSFIPDYATPQAKKEIQALADRTEMFTPANIQPQESWIKHWLELTEDGNPLYQDAELCKKMGYKALVVPPGMIGTWGTQFRWPWPPKNLAKETAGVHQRMKELLDLPVGIQVSQEIEFVRPIVLGDQLFYGSGRLEGIGEWKKTRLGEGHFWTILSTVKNQREEVIANNRSSLFGYGRGMDVRGVPGAGSPAKPKGGWSNAIEEAILGEKTGYQPKAPPAPAFEDVNIGDELPKLFMPITVTRCVYLASATRDFSPQHTNRDYAQTRSKTKDMFVNTPFNLGILCRFLTDWTGPQGHVRKVNIAMKGNVCAGDDMIITGKVTKKYQTAGENRVDVDILISTQAGPTTPCSGTVALPSRAAKKK